MKDILVLTYWSYRSGLIQTYTLPYLQLMSQYLEPGSRIFMVTLEQPGMALSPAEQEAARKKLTDLRIEWVALPYHRFGAQAAWRMIGYIFELIKLCRREKIAAIHCFCTPAGAIGYFISLLTGTPLILDSYEPHAESMAESGTWKRTGAAFRILFFLEKLQSQRAAAVVATTSGMREYAKEKYGVEFTEFHVKAACVDLALFQRDTIDADDLVKQYGLENKIVCVYAGKTGGIYLEREIFDLMKTASDFWGENFRFIFLSSDSAETAQRYCALSGFDPAALIHMFVDHEDIPRYMALGDFALTPVKPIPSKRYCTPIKDGEYWAMGLPVIITPNISDDSDIVEKHRVGAVLRGFSKDSYLQAIREIDSLIQARPRAALREKIRAVAKETRSLEAAAKVYQELYGRRI